MCFDHIIYVSIVCEGKKKCVFPQKKNAFLKKKKKDAK